MENSLKGLILAAGVIITCVVIGLGFFISREARDTAAKGAGQISKLNGEYNENEKILYDNLKVSGSEVINVINKFKNDAISIKVTTKKKTMYYINNLTDGDKELGSASSESVKDAQDSTNVSYINPNAQFMGEVIRDSNSAIVGIGFTQMI